MKPVYIIILIVVVFIIYRIVSLTFKVKQLDENVEKRKAKELKGEYNLKIVTNHVTGLPFAENIPVEVFSFNDRYEFNAQGSVINLEKIKVTDVCLKTDKEIQTQYASSVGGAVGGAVLFGPLGAVIGGRAKKKNTTTFTNLLIFTYESDGELKYIGFDVTGNAFKAQKFIDEFKQSRIRNNITINL